MADVILDGKAVAAVVRGQVKTRVDALRARGVAPGLAVVLVGDDPASAVYVRSKTKDAREVGIDAREARLPADATTQAVLEVVNRFALDSTVHGILVQMPTPPQVDARAVIAAIPAAKDVDGFTFRGEPALLPCTPAGIMRLLAEAGVDPAGLNAVVVGRSLLVGKPVANLLLAANATVTICHSKTRDLPAVVAAADIVVAAMGRLEFIKGAWIKPGAAVMDVGINRDAAGKLRGDVEYDAAVQRARVITPVPGGVGPMTRAYLLHNTVEACEALLDKRAPGTRLER